MSSVYIEHWENGFRENVRETFRILSQYLQKWILRKWKFRYNTPVTTTLAPSLKAIFRSYGRVKVRVVPDGGGQVHGGGSPGHETGGAQRRIVTQGRIVS
jgi:hypothetical protein